MSSPHPVTALDLSADDRARFADLAVTSHRVITRHQDPGGAYPASPDFSAYAGYSWLRDGAFTAEGVSRYGDAGSAGRFHDWAARTLARRRGQVDGLLAVAREGGTPARSDMLPTRFTFAGEDGTDEWWDFQTDGYGTWLWAVVTFARRHGQGLDRWRGGIEVAVDYLTAFWSAPCYDWWEEHAEHRHVSTLAAIHGGLRAVLGADGLDPVRADAAASVLAEIRSLVHAQGVAGGHLTKWLGSTAVDASLASAVVPFGLVSEHDPVAAGTLRAVADQLDTGGGVHRFRDDVFYGGGQWLLLSALLGWNLAVRGETGAALGHLRWIADQATEAGELPEQVPGHLLHPEHRQEWLDRWGPVATPLLWSHGMYLVLADELGLLPEEDAR
ncbi:glycoside hydrolase family 15 protein [Nocardioides sp. T2.26MG-1]|uniref:glycoside hydrolase family 15 protein n=1 Tax=Nocardioides sp. T2.26MG-1 TaxID=3041166 RepID=UPI002477CB1D|nr:glycoside hydrolase family 15 protein [Nocardioides sp. T2.26MG-1]CAI9403178.1 Isomaltose glucohydrolase [Nocardioides sp. T2.26MG-1]